jgi:hypothetical protein
VRGYAGRCTSTHTKDVARQSVDPERRTAHDVFQSLVPQIPHANCSGRVTPAKIRVHCAAHMAELSNREFVCRTWFRPAQLADSRFCVQQMFHGTESRVGGGRTRLMLVVENFRYLGKLPRDGVLNPSRVPHPYHHFRQEDCPLTVILIDQPREICLYSLVQVTAEEVVLQAPLRSRSEEVRPF